MSTLKLTGSSSGHAQLTVAAAAGTPTFTLPTTVGTANQAVANSSTPGTLAFKTLPFSEFDQWYLTANKTSDGYLTAWARSVDTWPGSAAQIGTGMSLASDTWTFPSTGKWLVILQGFYNCHDNDNVGVEIKVTTNNSSYGVNTIAMDGQNDASGGTKTGNATGWAFLDVTSTTNVKVKFYATSLETDSSVRGTTTASDGMQTAVMFIRIGDT